MLWRKYVFPVLAGIALSAFLVLQVSGYVVHFDPRWKLEGWENKNPGFKARISQSGLNFMRDVGIQMLQKEVQKITLPAIHGRTDITIGTLYYNVDNMHITNVKIPSSALVPNPYAHGLDLSASGISVSVHGDWHYEEWGFIPVSDSGDFDATASSIALALTLRIGVDSDGRPKVYSQKDDCTFHVKKLHVTLHGGGSWFYNLFQDQIVGSIKDSMNKQVCSTVVNQVNTDLENKLRSLKMVAPIENVARIDYSLVASPNFNGSITTTHKGEVYPIGRKTECPTPVPKIPPDSDSSRMMYLWITEYLPNSAGYVLQNVGFLQYIVTPDNVPPAEKKYLNTSNVAFKTLIPEISKLYPNMAMQISLNSTKAPVGIMKPDGLQAVFVGDFSPYAILPNKTLAFLFTLNVTIYAKVNVNSRNNNITWQISSLSTKMSLIRSAVGPFSTFMLENAVNIAIKLYFIKQLNQYGAIGVPLPQMDGFTFIKPVITQGQGFIKIGTDLRYTPEMA